MRVASWALSLLLCVAFLHRVLGEWCGNEDCYDVLKVTQRASLAEIRNAYKKLSMQFHPDKNPDAAQDRFQMISTAYEILSDERKRRRYDYAIQNPEGWIDEDGNYNDQPGSLDATVVSIGLILGCLFFTMAAKWITKQEFWSTPPTKMKKNKRNGKRL